VKRQERGGLEHDRDAPEPCGTDRAAAQRGDQPIEGLHVRGSFAAAVEDQQLLSQQQRFGDERACAPGPKKRRDRREQEDQQDREITHAAIVAARIDLARLEVATIYAKNF
jgi:hypothetical protein